MLTKVLEFIQVIIREFKKGVKELFAKMNKLLDEVFGLGEDVASTPKTRAEERWNNKQTKRNAKLERKKQGRKGKYNLEDVDVLGSKPANKEEIFEWKKKIKELTSGEKVELKLATKNTEAYAYLIEHKVTAYFEAHEIPPVIWYKEGSSNYVIAHEYFHLQEYYEIGREAFIKGDLEH